MGLLNFVKDAGEKVWDAIAGNHTGKSVKLKEHIQKLGLPCADIAKLLNFDYIIYMIYSIDFRRKVISTREEEGLSIRETAKQFRISSASISRWINQLEPKALTTRQQKINKSELIKDVEQYTDFTKRACRAFWRLSEGLLASS